VLRKIASRLLTVVRGEDNICRIGGDEFLVLMTDTDAASQQGRGAYPSHDYRHADPTRDGSMPVSVSVGFTVRAPNDPTPAETLIERADQALLQSKAAGRNRVRMNELTAAAHRTAPSFPTEPIGV